MSKAKRNPFIAPSLLSADFSQLGEDMRRLEAAGAHWFHIDVMDGRFVPNLTMGPPVIQSIRKVSPLPFDVHLMIVDPDQHLESFARAGANVLTVHQEACPHLHRTLNRIRQLGLKAGVSINPSTPVASLRDVLSEVDLVLIMSVNPGFGGQSFIPHSVQKVQQLHGLRESEGHSFLIEVDGGVGPQNARELARAGCDVFVAGSSVFNGGSTAFQKNMDAILSEARQG